MNSTITFASALAEELFEGRWDGLVKHTPEDILEECFIDLRLIEVSRLERDLSSTFKKRISSEDTDGTRKFVISGSSSDGTQAYSISFKWSKDGIINLDISFGSGDTKGTEK